LRKKELRENFDAKEEKRASLRDLRRGRLAQAIKDHDLPHPLRQDQPLSWHHLQGQGLDKLKVRQDYPLEKVL